ncbi:T9SS type A sorting domain-containing protein [bacterium]|nr:T9SS type A sorting domain-containing protein [bacterium]
MKLNVYKKAGLFVIMISLTCGLYAQIQWTADGIKSSSSNASLINVSAVSDGQGGTFLAYENDLSPDINIYAQWLDGSGTPRWGVAGKPVDIGGLNQKNPSVAPDGNGGFYIAWTDEGSGRIKAQRLNSSGNPLWTVNGVYVTNTSAAQRSVKIVPDNNGGIILAWEDDRNYASMGTDIYAQRLDNQGNKMWAAVGVAVTNAAALQSQSAAVIDGSGGIVVVWTDYRNQGTTDTDIYMQCLNASGTRQWYYDGNYEGIPVCTANSSQKNPDIIYTGNKIGIAWADKRNDQYDIYAHLFNMNADPRWSTVNGTVISDASGDQTNPKICRGADNGVIITWQDARSGNDIYVQRMAVGGAPVWAADGIPVISSQSWKGYPEILSDDAGGCIITWMDNRSGDFDIYAQHMNTNGNRLWNTNGLSICSASGQQYWHKMVSDGSGGAMTLWQDNRSSASDVYAQLVNDNLTIEAPTGGDLWAGTQSQTIEWTFHTSQIVFHHFSIVVSATPGDGFPITAAQNVSPAALSQSWTPGNVNSSAVQIRIVAYNSKNVKLSKYTSSIFTIDSEPPNAFNLTSPGDDSVVDLQPTFQWQATSDNLSGLDHYELVIDGQTVKNNLIANSYTLTSQEKLTDGQHNWFVRAVDMAGQARQSATWSITAAEDNTPPNPFNLAAPANNSWTKNINPEFTWEAATDDITGIHHYKLFVDGGAGPIADNIPPDNTSINTVTLAVGSHTWYIVAVDSAFNERSSTQTWTIKIDNVIPQAFSLVGPSNNSWHQTDTPTFSWQASQDGGCGLAEYELHIDGDSSPWIDDISPDITQLSLTQAQSLPEGTHTWYIVAKDVLGNSRASSATFTIGIDITSPEAFNILSPMNNAFVNTNLPTFTWQSATDAITDIAEYKLYIDEALNRDGLSTTSTTPVSALSEGEHSWQVIAVDEVGNSTWTSKWHFTVDTQPPAGFNLISPTPSQTVFHNKPTFSWQTTTDATSGFDHFELFVDDQKVADDLTAQQTEHTLSATLSNGNHTWKVIAYDKAGNSRQKGPRNFSTQVTPPDITSAKNAQATEDIFFIYTATATDAENDLLTFSFENYPGWLNADEASISGTPTEGITSTSFTVKVSDGIFEVSQQVNLTVTAVDDPPNITSPAAADATEEQNFIYTITATDPENDPITYSFSGYPGWMSVSGATIQGAPPEGVTSVNFTAIATANGKSDELEVTISIAGVDDPPQITSDDTGNATEDINYSYTAAATDPENDPITYSFSGYPDWMSASGAVIQGAPPEGVTAFSFTVTATANGKSDQQTVNVAVQAVDDAPQITSEEAVNAVEDVLFSYIASATDAENDPIILTFSQYPDWMTVSGSTIQGTPVEGVTAFNFTVTATANGKTDQLIVHVSVTSVDDPPHITSASAGNATEDILFRYTAAATDPENDPIHFTYSNYPDWMTVSGAVIEGTPANDVTTFSFKVTATANGKTDQKNVTISVSAVNDPPQITSADSVTATEDQLFTYTATATDEEGDPVSIAILNLPSWLTLNQTVVSGTPANGQKDTLFTVIAEASALFDTQQVHISILDVNDPPKITSPDTIQATEHQVCSYSVTATDIDGPNISVQFLSYPDWMKPMGRIIRGKVPANCQNTSFRVVISDNHPDAPLTDSLTVTVCIEQINDPPVFNLSFPDPQFQDPDTVRWTLALDDFVIDPDNEDNELTWSYSLIDSQNVIVFIDPGTHKVTIEATGMMSDFHIEFTVKDPKQASAKDTLTIGILVTAVEQKTAGVPEAFFLAPNYPNPFNPETTICYGIPRKTHVRLTVLNIRGEIVATLTDRLQTPGTYQIQWHGTNMASGLYFYRIETDEWQKIRRMIFLK